MNSIPQTSRALPVPHASPTAGRQRLPVSAPSPVPASASGDADDYQPRESFLQVAQRRGKQLLTGSAASLMLHMFLLGVLALISFGSSSSKIGLELAFSDAEAVVELEDIQFEMPALEEPDFSEELETVQIPEEAPADPVLELEPVTPVLLADSVIEPSAVSSDAAESLSASEPIASDGGAVAEDAGAKFYGIESEGSRFVFVIDASTSMLDGGRWTRAVEELLESISLLNKNQEFLVLTYSSRFRPMFNMPLSKIDLVRATRGNKRRLAKWLYQQQPGGITMPAGAMMVGLSLNVDAIYLLSDGLLMDQTDSMLRQHNQPRLLRYGGGKKTPVHAIAMDVEGDGADLLRVIAEENAGIFRVVQGAAGFNTGGFQPGPFKPRVLQ